MFINWYLTILLCLSFLIEFRKFDKRVREEEDGGLSKKVWAIFILILLAFGWLLGALTLAVPIHIYFLGVISIRLIIYWAISNILSKTPFKTFDAIADVLSTEGRWGGREWRMKRVAVLVIFLILLITIPFIIPGFVTRGIGYWQATSFKDNVDSFETGTIDTFPEIDPSALRVTTSDIARSIAETKRTSAESIITSVHLGMYDNQLSWICTVSEKPWLGMMLFEANRIREMIVIPVNDATGERSKVVSFQALYSEGLWFEKEIAVRANDMFPLRTFSRGYVTAMNDSLLVVTTSYIEIPFGPMIDPMIHVWNPVTGDLIAEYKPNDAPEWIIQRWDESYLEFMGDVFGDYRWTSDNELYYWYGLPVYSDRSANPSEPDGLRYQDWNGDLTAVYLFDNKRNEKVLELMIVATNQELTVYSLDHLGLLSPDDAKELSITGLPALPEEKSYRTPIALIYRIGSRIYYHIPIFIKARENQYYPAYFALVDCQSRNLLREAVEDYGSMTETAKALYEIAEGQIPVEENTLTGVLEDRDIWVENGDTRMWLTIDVNGTDVDVLAKAELLTPAEMHILLDQEIGETITVKVDENNVVIEVLA